jgi:protein-ribulosamine 3-kinase
VNPELRIAIERKLQLQFKTSEHLKVLNQVGGGSINQAYRLLFGQLNLFLKLNRKSAMPALFERECDGLKELHRASKIKIPKTILQDYFEEHAYLVLEWIETTTPTQKFWNNLAEGIVSMHQLKGERFGNCPDNYIGSLHQSNKSAGKWSEFWVNERLLPQLQICKNELSPAIHRSFESCFLRADDLFPEEKPSLLHGDLWVGNILVGRNDEVYLIDPAVYYGHREMDIAMMRLFGGVDAAFYSYYQEEYPMESGWELRLQLAMLYPLLVHVNLFGRSYVSQIEQIMKNCGF